ncbi:MAG: hypothetical protein GXO50_00215 [Chlorobi bacterium]|nr:hypothetical protein [Chlorobiota bacterium]
MANPFKKITDNANKNKTEYKKREQSEVKTRKCPNCGAARPEDTNLTICDYCGYKFMNIDTEIRLKNKK